MATMEPQQLRLFVMEKYIEGEITRKEAASYLDLSERQISRLKAGILKYGKEFITAKGRKPGASHGISEELRANIVELKGSDRYRDLSILQFQKRLEKECEISLSYSALYQILDEYGCITEKRQRTACLLGGPRSESAGQLVFLTEHPLPGHPLTETRGTKTHVFFAIDDCTRKILCTHLDAAGSIWGYFQVMDRLFEKNGLPMSIRIPVMPSLSEEQFSRVMDCLGIELCPDSDCPKDRCAVLERAYSAFFHIYGQHEGTNTGERQDIEERLNGAALVFNNLHGLRPKERSVFLPIIRKNYPTHLLCLHYQVTLNRLGGFTVNGVPYELEKRHNAVLPPPRSTVEVLIDRDMQVQVCYRGQLFSARPNRLLRA